MSETIETEGELPTRRSRADRPQREVHREPEIEIDTTPEASVDDAVAMLRRANEERDEARRRAEDAERARRDAEAAAAQAHATRGQDRQTVAASAVESAKADRDAAVLALRAARESGDIDAEVAAQERLSGATFRMAHATGELERLKSQPQPQQQQQRSDAPSPAAQRWLDEHPRYNTDTDYRRYANGLHNEAVQSGIPAGSDAYINYIEREMTARYGEGHGRADGGQKVSDNGRSERRGDGAPPSRGTGGGHGGWKSVTVPNIGEIRYLDQPNGGRRITAKPDVMAVMREGAQMDRRYNREPEKVLAEYMSTHIDMANNGYSDDNGSYWKTGDGQTWR